MNFGSRSEKVYRRIAQMEADLKALQKESDTLTGRVDHPAVQHSLRQTRTRKPFPESLPHDEKRLLPAEPCCQERGGSLSYLGEDAAEQLEQMRSGFRVICRISESRFENNSYRPTVGIRTCSQHCFNIFLTDQKINAACTTLTKRLCRKKVLILNSPRFKNPF